MITGEIHIDLKPLEGLKRSLITKILRKAIAQAVKPVKAAVKTAAQAVKRLGYLNKSIGYKVRIYGDTAVAIVGPRSGWKIEKGTYTKGKRKGQTKVFRPSVYEHLIEKGTTRSRARPVLAPALSASQSEYISRLTAVLTELIQQELSD